MTKWALAILRSTCAISCTLTGPPCFMAARSVPLSSLAHTHTLRHLPSLIHLQTQTASRHRPRALPASSPASSPLGLTSPSPPHQT